jgi:ubiquinone/menaquinone biosynthesis C-methylase UbiE
MPESYPNSIIVKKQKDDVRREYTQSSQLPTDSEKAMWGSEESMLNRFRLGLDVITWQDVETWLDIGCGTGRFFELAEEQNLQFRQMIGVDFTVDLIAEARGRQHTNPARFETSDFEAMPADIGKVDLVTVIGVLQLCGCPLDVAMKHCVDRLAPGGQIFLTTKHLGWSAFAKKGFDPGPNHSWFLMDDVRQAVSNCGVNILKEGGLAPREGEIVPLKDAHTLFVLGQKSH